MGASESSSQECTTVPAAMHCGSRPVLPAPSASYHDQLMIIYCAACGATLARTCQVAIVAETVVFGGAGAGGTGVTRTVRHVCLLQEAVQEFRLTISTAVLVDGSKFPDTLAGAAVQEAIVHGDSVKCEGDYLFCANGHHVGRRVADLGRRGAPSDLFLDGKLTKIGSQSSDLKVLSDAGAANDNMDQLVGQWKRNIKISYHLGGNDMGRKVFEQNPDSLNRETTHLSRRHPSLSPQRRVNSGQLTYLQLTSSKSLCMTNSWQPGDQVTIERQPVDQERDLPAGSSSASVCNQGAPCAVGAQIREQGDLQGHQVSRLKEGELGYDQQSAAEVLSKSTTPNGPQGRNGRNHRIRVKLQWRGNTKVVALTGEANFAHLRQSAMQAFPEIAGERSGASLEMKYQDREGDTISIDSDEGLQEALLDCGMQTLRIVLECRELAFAGLTSTESGGPCHGLGPVNSPTARSMSPGAPVGNLQRVQKEKPICRHFQRGSCWNGPDCRFSHACLPTKETAAGWPLTGGKMTGSSLDSPRTDCSSTRQQAEHRRGSGAGRDSTSAFQNERQMEGWLRRMVRAPPAESLEALSSDHGLKQLSSIFDKDPNVLRVTELVVDLLANNDLRTSMLREKTNKVYGAIGTSPFLRGFHSYVQALARPDGQALEKYMAICEEVQTRTTNGWKEVPLDAIKGRIDELPEGPQKQRLTGELQRLMEHRDRLRRTLAIQPGHSALQGKEFRKWPIIPTPGEMNLVEAADLPENRLTSKYNSVIEYLETHFRLLREDCIEPLRVGIRHYRQQTPGREVRIYTNVRIAGIRCGNSGIEYRLSFATEKKRPIRWESSKRLMFGALLCLSADNFQTLRWATVSHRDVEELSEGFVDVRILSESSEGLEGSGLEADREFLMAESAAAYFEAYAHVLRSLQRPEMEGIPFQQNLLCLDPTVAPPAYFLSRELGDEYDFSSAFPQISKDLRQPCVRVLQEWPQWESTLDESQRQALQRALTKELAVIQGPPGTGKTFVGLLAVQLLLVNLYGPPGHLADSSRNDLDDDEDNVDLRLLRRLVSAPGVRKALDAGPASSGVSGPILVVCYTNHALDQFLGGILKVERSVIRIGGQCKDPALKARNLYQLLEAQREVRGMERSHHHASREARGRVSQLQAEITTCVERLNLEYAPAHLLHGVATEDQIANLFWDTHDAEAEAELASREWVKGWLEQPFFSRRMYRAQPEQRPEVRAAGGAPPGRAAHEQRPAGNNFEVLDGFPEEAEEEQGRAGLREDGHGLLGEGAEDAAEEGDEEEIRQAEEDRQAGLAERERAGGQMQLLRQHPQPGDEAGPAARDPDYELEYYDAAPPGMAEGDGWQPVQGRRGAGRGRRHQGGYMAQAVDEEEEVAERGDTVQLEDVVDYPAVWQLNTRARHILHAYWLKEIQSAARTRLQELVKEYEEACSQVKEVDSEIQLALLRKCRVVGMTTTGAARYHDILMALKPEIIVVEEAAEVLEAHIVACLSPFTKQLILIGDHQQLRPSVAVYRLAKQLHLDVSLFERLMRNGIEHTTLQMQHRMRPSIARLISSLYPTLQNHPCVAEHPEVRGMASSVFLLDHRAEEESAADTGSKSNVVEAELVVGLCCYLLRQGYSTEQITVLTMYTGQLLEIKRRLRARLIDSPGTSASSKPSAGPGNVDGAQLRPIPRVSSVDNYQGEECDIILLSLVRSNRQPGKDGPGTIGFLSVSNRVCVALSRARAGLFIFGNAELLAARSELWARVVKELKGRGEVGPDLVLRCQNHPDTETRVSEPHQFAQVTDGGCSKPCEYQLDCGHACPRRCHPDSHDAVICPKPCRKELPNCSHACQARCHGLASACPPCPAIVERAAAPCGHPQQVRCSTDMETYRCRAPCPKRLPCGHPCRRACYQPCTDTCPVAVQKRLPCGHLAQVLCSQDPAAFSCTVPCRALLPGCQHRCRGTCGACAAGHIPCQEPCARPLPCGHFCGEKCAAVCPPCKRPCRRRCVHSRCRLACGAPCVPCREPCASGCAHARCRRLCHEPCDRPDLRCNEPCPLRLTRCGHPCAGLCGEPCPRKCRVCHPATLDVITQMRMGEAEPEDRFVQLLDCGHVFEVSGLDQWMDQEDAGPSGGAAGAVVVKLKECPACRTPIRRTYRYADIVKKRLAQVEEIKRKINGYEAVNVGNSFLADNKPRQARKLFQEALDLNPLLPEAHFGLACALCRLQQPQEAIPHLKAVVRSSQVLSTWHRLQTDESAIFGLGAQFGSGSKSTGEDSALGHDDVASASPCERTLGIQALVQWAAALTQTKQFVEAVQLCDRVLAVDPDNTQVRGVKEKAAKGEMGQVVQAMMAEVGGKGHWYQCPQGHYYTVGECGGPMETSRCPDCQATVGGTRHTPAAGNRHASIDGSSHSAWSTFTGLGAGGLNG